MHFGAMRCILLRLLTANNATSQNMKYICLKHLNSLRKLTKYKRCSKKVCLNIQIVKVQTGVEIELIFNTDFLALGQISYIKYHIGFNSMIAVLLCSSFYCLTCLDNSNSLNDGKEWLKLKTKLSQQRVEMQQTTQTKSFTDIHTVCISETRSSRDLVNKSVGLVMKFRARIPMVSGGVRKGI